MPEFGKGRLQPAGREKIGATLEGVQGCFLIVTNEPGTEYSNVDKNKYGAAEIETRMQYEQ